MRTDYDRVLIDGQPFPGVVERLLEGKPITDAEYFERCLEAWKRRSPDVDVLEIRTVSKDEIEIHVAHTPAMPVGRIESTFVFRQDEPVAVHSDHASG